MENNVVQQLRYSSTDKRFKIGDLRLFAKIGKTHLALELHVWLHGADLYFEIFGLFSNQRVKSHLRC